MKAFGKIAKIVSKIAEVFCWIFTAIIVILVPVGLIAVNGLREAYASGELQFVLGGEEIDLESLFEMIPALLGYAAYGIIFCVLMALVFRNLHRTVKLCCASTPFQPAAVRSARRMGILLIAQFTIAVLFNLLIAILSYFTIQNTSVAVSANITVDLFSQMAGPVSYLFLGLLALAAAHAFEQGIQLQDAVEAARAAKADREAALPSPDIDPLTEKEV